MNISAKRILYILNNPEAAQQNYYAFPTEYIINKYGYLDVLDKDILDKIIKNNDLRGLVEFLFAFFENEFFDEYSGSDILSAVVDAVKQILHTDKNIFPYVGKIKFAVPNADKMGSAEFHALKTAESLDCTDILSRADVFINCDEKGYLYNVKSGKRMDIESIEDEFMYIFIVRTECIPASESKALNLRIGQECNIPGVTGSAVYICDMNGYSLFLPLGIDIFAKVRVSQLGKADFAALVHADIM